MHYYQLYTAAELARITLQNSLARAVASAGIPASAAGVANVPSLASAASATSVGSACTVDRDEDEMNTTPSVKEEPAVEQKARLDPSTQKERHLHELNMGSHWKHKKHRHHNRGSF